MVQNLKHTECKKFLLPLSTSRVRIMLPALCCGCKVSIQTCPPEVMFLNAFQDFRTQNCRLPKKVMKDLTTKDKVLASLT